jgi:hypothetical protein
VRRVTDPVEEVEEFNLVDEYYRMENEMSLLKHRLTLMQEEVSRFVRDTRDEVTNEENDPTFALLRRIEGALYEIVNGPDAPDPVKEV